MMKKPLDLYFWPTPNGWKVTILLEELGVPYSVIPVNIAKGEQFTESYQRVSPNSRIPAIVDHHSGLKTDVFGLFESGAILQYLAVKYGRYFPEDPARRWQCMQWLFWQVGGLGPMGGQAHHFRLYASEKIPYAIDRYSNECRRLYGVLDKHLTDREYLCEDYTIADMASLPWIYRHERQGIKLEEFPALNAWYERLMGREGVQKGISVGESWRGDADFDSEEARRILFGKKNNPTPGLVR